MAKGGGVKVANVAIPTEPVDTVAAVPGPSPSKGLPSNNSKMSSRKSSKNASPKKLSKNVSKGKSSGLLSSRISH